MTFLWDYEQPLETVSSFNYMRRLLTVTEDNWPAVITNLWKDRNIWYLLGQILGQEGADTRVLGHFYVSVVQDILMFGLEMWVVTPCIKRLLEGVPP